MASLIYQLPQAFVDEKSESPGTRAITPTAGHSTTTIIQENDFIVLASGFANRAATNTASALFGLTEYSETEMWGGSTYAAFSRTGAFGVSSGIGTLLAPEPVQIKAVPLFDIPFDVSLRNDATVSVGWISGGTNQVVLGTQVGLYLDTVSNMFVVDPTQSNKVAVIYDKLYGPTNILPNGQYIGNGVAGDTGGRVRIKFLSSVLV